MRVLAIYLLTLVFTSELLAQESKNVITDFPESNLWENFDTLISRHGLVYTTPINFKQVKPKKNRPVGYQYAIEKLDEKFEIRYMIFDLDSAKKRDVKHAEWNIVAKTNFETILLAASKKGSPASSPIIEYPPESVKDEFNADWGATESFIPSSKFGKKFKHCVSSTIIKDSTSQVVMFFMFEDVQKQENLLTEHYYNLKFKTRNTRREVRYRFKREEEYPGDNDFYINTSANGLRIRQDNKEIKEAYLTISDNYGTIYYQGKMTDRDFYLNTLEKGKYRLKIDYNGNKIQRLIEIFYDP